LLARVSKCSGFLQNADFLCDNVSMPVGIVICTMYGTLKLIKVLFLIVNFFWSGDFSPLSSLWSAFLVLDKALSYRIITDDSFDTTGIFLFI
jgi:hypothetical protein